MCSIRNVTFQVRKNQRIIHAGIIFLLIFCTSLWAGEPGSQSTTPSNLPPNVQIYTPRVPYYSIPDHLELCGETVPLQTRDARERLEREFLISVYNPAQVYLWLKRKGRYFPYIERRLKEEHLPDDLKYLAVAESDLMDYAYSPKGAAGHWQFIRSTARRYGLKINRKKDERLNFFKATEAAFTYLKELHEEFGTWSLAMAAYNCGEIRIRKEIQKQGTRDYYQMNLPTETERYVFRILAIKIIMSNPEKYGYFLPQNEEYQEVKVERVWVRNAVPLPMRIVAEACNTCFKEIKELNPEYSGYYIPKGLHEITVPYGCSQNFKQSIATLISKSKRISHHSRVRVRDETKESKKRKYHIYKVKRGDTLSGIARSFGVSVKKIKIWNSLSRNTVIPGQNIKIFE